MTPAPEQIRSIIERIERADAERADAAEAVKEVYAEAKANGFDPATIRKVVARRKLDRDAVSEADAMLEMYETAIEGAQ